MTGTERALLEELEKRFGIALTPLQIEQMESYWALLQKWNRRLSLSTVSSFSELMEFHFFESFLGAVRLLRESEGTVADIGSGAGFPGIALQVLQPWRRVKLLEKHQRKSVFLMEAVKRLDIESEVRQIRAEDFPWGQVEAATVRALKTSAELERRLAEAGVPLLAFHGRELPLSGTVRSRLEAQIAVPGSQRRMISRLVFG